jgi:hypothetical protein
LNLGLRWEYDGLLSDKYGRLTQLSLDRMVPNSAVPTAFSPTGPLGIQQYVVPSNFVANFGPPPEGVGISNNRHSMTAHAPYSNFAPRFGFAWQPLSGAKLVVRGGVGIFYNRVGLDSVVHAYEQGFPYGATYDYSPPSARWEAATLAAPYPIISLVCLPSDPNCNSNFGLGFAPRYSDWTTGANSSLSSPYDPAVHTPLVREYSLGIQYEFAQDWVLDLGYVGSSGINLLNYNHNHNQALLATPTNSLSYLCDDGDPPVCNTSGNAEFRVPYLGYQTAGLQATDFNGFSNYNSFQATVRHQFSHGLSLQAAYTWSKNLSTIFYSNTANINNALCMSCQYGRVSFNRPQRFVMNYSYDLPFGKGMSGLGGKVIGGWNVSGITIAQSGNPLTLISTATGTAYGTSTTSYLSGVSTAQLCTGYTMADIYTSGPMTSRVGAGNNYFNPDAFGTTDPDTGIFTPCPSPVVPYGDPYGIPAFGIAPALDYGNTPIGGILGPGQFNWDISILKTTPITERVKMQFRADFYNAFNHPQFSDPGGGSFGTVGFEVVSSPSAVRITHTSVNPRLIQFGVRFMF